MTQQRPRSLPNTITPADIILARVTIYNQMKAFTDIGISQIQTARYFAKILNLPWDGLIRFSKDKCKSLKRIFHYTETINNFNFNCLGMRPKPEVKKEIK